jgi:hypothetical protein
MKRIATKMKYIPSYETGSNMSEIAAYLRQQIASNKPMEVPKGLFGSAYALQGGALGASLAGIAGQDTSEEPFIPNPSDVSAAFQKLPIGTTLDSLDNFFSGQQQSLTRALSNNGMASYDVANAVAKPMADASKVRSDAALGLIRENNQIDRQRAGFNMEIDKGVTAARNQENMNENQKLAMLSGKTAEGLGALGNINADVFKTKQAVEASNNTKLSSLMNQLFTANYLDKLYAS